MSTRTVRDRFAIAVEAVLCHTIWGKNAVDRVPPRYRVYVRVVFPIVYALNILIFGIVGLSTSGSGVLQKALPDGVTNGLYLSVASAATIAFLGVIFGGGKRTRVAQQVERIGCFLILPPILAYFFVLCQTLTASATTPLGAMLGTALMIMIALLRGFDLSVEIGKRDSARKVY